MKQRLITLLILAGLTLVTSLQAQKKWTLEECISHAIENNIEVQKMGLNSRQKANQLNTAKNSRLPAVNANMDNSTSIGRGMSREGVIEDHTVLSSSVGASLDLPLFSGFAIKHSISMYDLDLQAALKDQERAQEDVAIRVTSIYLQVLFNKELVKIAENQIELTKTHLARTEALVNGGRSPESEIFENKALLAKDELSLTECQNNLMLSLVDLSQALNIEHSTDFDILEPDTTPQQSELLYMRETPEDVFSYSNTSRPHIQAERYRLESSEKSLLLAKSARYPRISLGAGYNTGYFYTISDLAKNASLNDQLRMNAKKVIGISLSVPIFNRFNTRNQIRSAEIQIQSQRLAVVEAERALYKEIEQSYYNANAALAKYRSAESAVTAARIAFEYESVKSESGKSTVFTFNDAKTRLERSESEALQAKYEFMFREKIYNFYQGIPLGRFEEK